MSATDVHVHAFPTPEMGLDWQRLLGVEQPRRSGHVDELRGLMSEASIECVGLLLNFRSAEHHRRLRERDPERGENDIRQHVARRIRELNRWGVGVAREDPRFLAFVGVDVRYMDAGAVCAEIDEMAAAGARGVKIIPPLMRVYANDPLLQPVFQRCWELGLAVLSQSGDGGGPPPAPGADHYGRPKHHEDNLRNFPGLRLILAHLGHGYSEDIVAMGQRYPNLYTDTSLQLSGLGRPGHATADELVTVIRRIGTEHVLLGSNYPFVDPAVYVRRLAELPITDHEKALIGRENAIRALQLAGPPSTKAA